MQNITTFLWFDGQAEEAANFYASVFKNCKVGKVVRAPGGGPVEKGAVLLVEFEISGQKFAGLNGGPQFKFSESVSFAVNVETQAELDDLWNKLTSDGGKESQCGWCKDKFGVSWQIVPSIIPKVMTDPATAGKAMAAVMPMKKIDIATIERAVKAG